MIVVRDLTEQDALAACGNCREDDRDQYERLTGMSYLPEIVAADIMQKNGAKWAAEYNGTLFVIGGYEPLVNAVWQSWMVSTTEDWARNWRAITKVSRRAMDAMFDVGARRLQTIVLASRAKTCEWYVKGLKMSLDGLLPGFGANGETAAIYSRVRE